MQSLINLATSLDPGADCMNQPEVGRARRRPAAPIMETRRYGGERESGHGELVAGPRVIWSSGVWAGRRPQRRECRRQGVGGEVKDIRRLLLLWHEHVPSSLMEKIRAAFAS
jgi:hypothetical protein